MTGGAPSTARSDAARPHDTTSDPHMAAPQTQRSPRYGLVRELWHLLRTTKKWWLVPILLGTGILALFVILGSTSVAPFIYSIF